MAPVIDFRVRPGTHKVLAAMSPTGQVPTGLNRWGHPCPSPVTLDEFVRQLDDQEIDRVVFTGRQRSVGPDAGGLDNDYVAETAARYPDRITGFASADVGTGVSASVRELRRALGDLGLRGLSVDPFLSEAFADDRRLYPLYEVASEFKVPVVITLGPLVGRWGDPVPVDHVAAEFPDTRFLLSHGCWPQVDELLALAYRRPNVYLEPSLYYALPGSDPFIEAAKGIFRERVIYASAFPFAPLDIKDHFIKTYELDGDALRRILGANAATFLGLDDQRPTTLPDLKGSR